MAVLWVILILTSSGLHYVHGLPVNPSSRIYSQEASELSVLEQWTAGGGLYAALPALALVFAAFGLLFGCTWCYRHKDCKPNEGAENQIFTASVTHLHDARRSQPPDSGFSEPAGVGEDNNNGPISLREMQNIANNNAAVYIASEHERGRESVVEFEPLPTGIGVLDPLERCADWFAGEDLPRDRLQYLREIGRGWFGRVVKGEVENGDATTMVAVKILNQNASLEDKARFLDEARMYRDLSHDNILAFVAKCLQEDPWLLIFELCSMDLQQYIVANRAQMERLNESGTPLQLMCDVTSALANVHARGYVYRNLWSGNILVRGEASPRAVLGQYAHREPPHELRAPETARHPHRCTTASDVWSLGHVVWELCAWAPLPPPASHLTPPAQPTPPAPPAHALYGDHLYQVMQLCWNTSHEARPSAAQVHALIDHLLTAHAHSSDANDDGYGSSDFEERWQRLKPNTIPKIDEHIAIVHAPSTSMASHFTGSEQEFDNAPTTQDSLSIDIDTAVSRSSSIMSDKDPLHAKSDSLTNLHGSLEDVRNIYLTHNEMATLECHQGNIALEEGKEREHSDSSVDPWLKDIITDSQDDVSYYRDVSDVIKNLDNILNSEKTSSSESSHQASPSRDNLSLECKKESPMQTSMVKSPGISNFKNILEMDFDSKSDAKDCEDEGDADTIGSLSHSFERHSDTTSQQTLENITPETPIKDLDILNRLSENETNSETEQKLNIISETASLNENDYHDKSNMDASVECNNYEVPKLKELCIVSMPSISKTIEDINEREDCQKAYASEIISNDNETKSIENKIDLRNEIDNINCDTNTEMKLNGNKVKINTYTAQYIEEVNDTNKEVKDVCTENYVDMKGNNKNTECSKILNDLKLDNTLLSEALTNTSISGSLQNEPTINEILINNPTLFFVSPEMNITWDPIKSISETKNESNAENINFVDAHKISPSETFIISEIVEDDKYINDDCEHANSNIASTLLSNDLDPAKQNNLPHGFHDDIRTVESIIQELTEQKIVTALLDRSNHGNVLDNASANSCNLSQTINEEDLNDEKQSCQEIDESIQEKKENVISIDTISQTSLGVPSNIIINETFNVDKNSVLGFTESFLKQITELPETVQILSNSTPLEVNLDNKEEIVKQTSPQLSNMSVKPAKQVQSNSDIDRIRESDLVSSVLTETEVVEKSSDSTIYMDLTDNKENEKLKGNINKDNSSIKRTEAPSVTNVTSSSLNESTVYLDLPNMIKETHDFLHSEKLMIDNEKHDQSGFKENMLTSTPKGSENSIESTLEPTEEETTSITKIAAAAVGDTFTKPKNASENFSPFESPTKSHPTDTYEENSSVVLGSLENCMFESLKTLKSELVDIPKEELLAFSSNFSEINLETPSPLRDGNFLNEVPDILSDELQFDGIENIEAKSNEPGTENTTESEELSSTKRVSPSTPPNSPGNFLISTSQTKYLVDIDINTDSSTGNTIEEVHLNQIELQMTTKIAMAENENNMNIEYSGPVELDEPRHAGAPECYLAGNAGSVDYQRGGLAIDKERMKELRNELELKLPLAQVSGIEPAREWSPPPPPELVVLYGALSPIAEETRGQLSAYENDDHWNQSVRTESSESYPEPCNNSTDEVTDLPTGLQSGPNHSHSTYTLHSKDNSINHTYTVPKEVPACSSKEITMSADSLNSSPLKFNNDVLSPIDDKTYTKADEEKDSNCERLSQISPFLVSPTTDTSAPDNSDLAAGMSTLSRTTVPTDAKFSKPSETQCLSKATSIDSWCSNDTLYNVEENFDDLAMDPDVEYEVELEKDKSESDGTLAHDDDKENSHCSTYIVHDSKSEACETFSPDSITANDNYTYTKVKTEVVATTPSLITKSELNDSNDTKNTQTKDLAYGTLMSGLPSFSNCTTELVSGMDDTWRLPQPELVRKSPISCGINFTPPRAAKDDRCEMGSPKCTSEPVLKKMDSVEISCLKDIVAEAKYESPGSATECVGEAINDSLNRHFRNMALSVTSTPCLEAPPDDEDVETTPLHLPNNSDDSSDIDKNVPNFNVFFQSAEIRPQDISSNINEERVSKEILLEGDSETLSRESNKDGSGKTPTYSDFEFSAVTKPQDVSSKEKYSQGGESSEEFKQFQNSAVNCPQDLSSLIDASSLLLKSERRFCELASSNLTNIDFDFTNQTESRENEPESLTFNSPIYTNLVESHNSNNINVYITDIDEDENEQPHSIIVTEVPLVAAKLTSNITHNNVANLNDIHTFDQNTTQRIDVWNNEHSKYLNRTEEIIGNIEESDLKSIDSLSIQQCEQSKQTCEEINGSQDERNNENKEPSDEQNAVTCNGTNEVYATINIISETFEELVESNVDDNDTTSSETGRDEQVKSDKSEDNEGFQSNSFTESANATSRAPQDATHTKGAFEDKVVSVTDDFLQNEKKFCQLDSIFPLLSDIRFTGPATEIMSTSFTQDSPTEPTSPEYEQDSKPDPTADILKEWDSDSDSHSTNSSSGEFIWKQRDSGQPSRADDARGPSSGDSASGDSGSGSEGDEVEFVPSSWDCRAAPSKSSLRSLEQPTLAQDTKKRVVFKRQKYHCVYEYPRETIDLDVDSPAYLPDFSTYSDWDPRSAAEAELGYGQLFGAPSPLDVFPLRAGIAFGPDYVEDFFISSSARPFERLGGMSTSSQFFPGLHKQDLCDEEPLSPLPPLAPAIPSPIPPLLHAKTPSLDFTTPDSGVEDITPGSLADEDYKRKVCEWRGDSASSSESVSPSSPGEALGGLRHTRDRLKLDLPPSPLAPSPRHSRVFSFVLDKPRRPDADTPHTPPVPDTPPAPYTPQPTFSTFGKAQCRPEPEKNIVLTDEPDTAPTEREATVLDSGDEDSGIESSSKATLDGNGSTPNVS